MEMIDVIKKRVKEYGARGYFVDPTGLIGIREDGLVVWHRWLGAGVLAVSGSTHSTRKGDTYYKI